MIDRSADGVGVDFATAVVLWVRCDGAVRYASAGAVGPLLARDGGCKALGTPHDLLLGLDRDAAYAERTYALAPGDRLVVVTDGVFESRHDRFRRRRLGIRTVARVIEAAHRRAVALTATRIFEDLEAYNGGRYEDDATIVVASALANVTARAKTPQ
jgi:serine phosphatase RsbU (regulator of sigma subunit)